MPFSFCWGAKTNIKRAFRTLLIFIQLFTSYLIDTNVVIHYDDSSGYIIETLDGDNIDTSVVYIRHSIDGDTTFVGLQPWYAFDENNQLINICDAQGRQLSKMHFSAQALTVAPNPAADESFVLFSVSEATMV